MSDSSIRLEILSISPSHIIDDSIVKDQPGNTLVNKYLSTAAQYLSRTKSFHVSPTTDNNNNHCRSNVDHSPQVLRKHQLDFDRSIPGHLHDNQSSMSNEIPSDCNKSQGFVNTLRRSLRKSKERFYNKRSATMKSCHSLHNYDQTSMNNQTNNSTPMAMTPTLSMRQPYSTNSCSNTPKNRSMPPLNPLVGSGRDQQRTRSINNGPLTATHHTQLPSAGSLQSLTSANLQTSTDAVNQSVSVQTIDEEKDKLRNDLLQMKNELQKSKELIARLQKSEEQMRERLAEQAQRQLEKGGKFEDLNQVSRPTELIRSFNTLYSQARIDALDALDTLREMSNAEDLKSKLLFSVVVLAFRHSQIHARDIRLKVKQILQLSNDKTSIVLEETIEKYLRSTIQKYDVSKIAIEVENQLWMTLYDYPSLKSCHELLKYINSACRTAWGLVNQTPPYSIEFQTIKYDKQIHERFHTSDNDSDTIIEYIWPCLIDGRDRTCVAKGVVITDQRLAT